MKRLLPCLMVGTALLLSACSSKVPEPEPKVKAKTTASADRPVAQVGEQPGTPMAERVAVIGLLNKRNGQTRNFELKPGESVRFGKVVLRVRACERTAPWETYQDEGAFVQMIIRQRPPGTNDAERWAQVFSGWLFKENPAANIAQHPIYDVWVKQCKMSFPGEEAPAEEAPESSGEANKPSSAPQAPRARPAPAAPADEPEEEVDAGEGEATEEA
jgi:hypothetical protein